MMNTVKQAVWLCLLLIGLAVSGWFFVQQPQLHKLDNNTLASTPDAIIYQLKVRQFDVQGLMVNQLETPMLRHIPKDDTYFLVKPRILAQQDKQPAWRIQSQRAIAYQGGERIKLLDNVIVRQKKDKDHKESTLKTEALTYYPKLKKATTPLFVTLKQPGALIEANGMNVYLADKTIELLNKARGRYVPSHG